MKASKATQARYWKVMLPVPEREILKRLARRQGLPVRSYCGLVLRDHIRNPKPPELVPLLDSDTQ
jgi:hypothetical protein